MMMQESDTLRNMLKNSIRQASTSFAMITAYQIVLEALDRTSPFQTVQTHLLKMENTLQEGVPERNPHRYLREVLPALALLEGYSSVHLESHVAFYARIEGQWNMQTGWRETMIAHPLTGRPVFLRKHATRPEYYESRHSGACFIKRPRKLQ